jgi:hypothetical protein
MEGPGEPPSNIMPIISNKPSQPSSCQHLTKSHLYVKLNSNRCIPLCEADIMFDAQEKHLAETWINSWSIAALFLAILATLCLILSNARWDKKLMVGSKTTIIYGEPSANDHSTSSHLSSATASSTFRGPFESSLVAMQPLVASTRNFPEFRSFLPMVCRLLHARQSSCCAITSECPRWFGKGKLSLHLRQDITRILPFLGSQSLATVGIFASNSTSKKPTATTRQ